MPQSQITITRSADDHVHLHDSNRGQWASKREFILSCIGYAIGTGNVWRFPYLCYRSGGGAFLIPYLLMLFLCGIPLFFMEVIIGQFSSTGCLSMFRMCPILKGTGHAMIVVNFLCVCYYSVIISYPVRFVTKLFTNNLPWLTCDNPWNTPKCVNINNITRMLKTSNIRSIDFRTPADEFFHHEILQISSGIEHMGGIVWPMFYCLLFSWFCIFLCIVKGVKSVGKVVYFTALFPFLILIIFFIRGVTLPGAEIGIIFYLKPDWKKIIDLKVWADAALQIFFSLGPGWGGIINMASYNNFRNDPKIDSMLVPILNSGTSIFAGFVVFSVLGYMSEKTGIPVPYVATGGPGLAFVTYPQAIAMLPLPHFWAAMFFIMLFFMGLDSIFVQIEAIIGSIVDEIAYLRQHKFKVTVVTCLLMLILSTSMVTNGGMYIVQLFDWYSAAITVIFICLIETVMVSYIYGIDRFANDIYFMLGKYPCKCHIICLKYITPAVLLVIFLTTIIFNRKASYNNIDYPNWAIALGWASCALSVICVPVYMFFFIMKRDGSCISIIKLYSKSYDWSPAKEEHRTLYEKFMQSKDEDKIKFVKNR